MEHRTPSLREQGMQALREGSLDRAIDLLARAVMADDRDAEAKALLGIAYSQKGLHAQAQRALLTASELEPRNVSFRYNLGVVLERAGDVAGAARAYQETLRLQPDHEQARSRLEAMGPQAAEYLSQHGAAGAGAPPGPPPGYPPPPGAPQAGEGPGAGGYAPPSYDAPPPGGPPPGGPAGYGVPGGYSAPPPGGPAVPPPGAPGYGYAGAGGFAVVPDMSSGEAFFRRLAAAIIDGVLVGCVATVIAIPLLAVSGVGPGSGGEVAEEGVRTLAAQQRPGGDPTAGVQLLANLLGLLLQGVYAGIMYSTRGQTLGKMALGLRVVGPDGQNPGFLRGFLRDSLGKTLSGCVCALGYLWMLWDRDQQTWHDKLAGTRVLRN